MAGSPGLRLIVAAVDAEAAGRAGAGRSWHWQPPACTACSLRLRERNLSAVLFVHGADELNLSSAVWVVSQSKSYHRMHCRPRPSRCVIN